MKPYEYNDILTGLITSVSGLKERQPSAGRGLLMESLLADTVELTESLKTEVLVRVSREIWLEADEGIVCLGCVSGARCPSAEGARLSERDVLRYDRILPEHRQGPSQLSAQGEEMGPHPTPARPFRAPEGIEKTTRAEISALVNHNAISLHPV